jgi:hypothetical protein
VEDRSASKASADLSAEEAAYDRGYDDGWKARDALAGEEDNFKNRVRAVLREVGLLGYR